MNNHSKICSTIILGLVYFCISCLAGCGANPLNQATYYRYIEQGDAAIDARNWGGAEIAYYRALMNVEWGNLDPSFEIRALYGLGLANRSLGKLNESEELFKKALVIAEQLYGRDGFRTSYVIAELVRVLYMAEKYDEGALLLVRLEPIILQHKHDYSEHTKLFFKETYKRYAEELSKQGRLKEAEKFKKISDSLLSESIN